MSVFANKIKSWWTRVRQSALLYGFFGTGVRIGSQLILLPLILNPRFLSKSEFELWGVFLALGNLTSLADFGLGQVVSRVYNYLWAGADDFDSEGLRPPPTHREPNLPHIRRLNRAIRHIYFKIASRAGVLIGIGGTLFLFRLIHRSDLEGWLWAGWGIYVVIITYGIATSHWVLACAGVNRVRDDQTAFLVSGLVYLASATTLLFLGGGVFSLVIASGLRVWVQREICRQAYLKSVPSTEEAELDLGILAKLWPNARKFGILLVGAYLMSNGSVLICSQLLDVATTNSWILTAQVGNFMLSVSTIWLVVKWPGITMLRTQGRLQEMSMLFARRLALVLGSFLFLAAMAVLIGNDLLAWKGSHTRLLPLPCLLVYFCYLAQNLFYGQFGMLALTENVIPFFKVSLYTGLAMFCLSCLLTTVYGLWGMLLAPLIAEMYCCQYVVRRGFQGQPLTAGQLTRAALLGRMA